MPLGILNILLNDKVYNDNLILKHTAIAIDYEMDAKTRVGQLKHEHHLSQIYYDGANEESEVWR